MTDLQLYRYQEKAKDFLLENNRCGLFLKCGLGKTAVTLTALKELPVPALVIAPKRVIEHTWPTEIKLWYPDAKAVSLTGSPAERQFKLNQKADIYLINFELFTWLVDQNCWKWPTVVIDESSRVKNHSSKLFKAMRKVAGKWERLVELTGTPSPNGLQDLWSQMYLIDKGFRLGKTVTAFRNRWFVANYMGWSYEPRPNAQSEIENLCKDVCLSMMAEDYLDLPDMMIDDIYVDLPPVIRGHYKNLKKKLVAEINGEEVTAVTAAVLANKLLQLTSGAVYNEYGEIIQAHETKFEALDDILASIGNESIIIVYQFKHELAALRKRYKQGVEIRDNGDVLNDWNEGKVKMLFIHPASAGHGLNLQHGGRHMVWTTPTWNLEYYEQTNARLHRNGQTMPVMIYRLIAANTIDERVIDTLGNKDAVQSALMQALKGE